MAATVVVLVAAEASSTVEGFTSLVGFSGKFIPVALTPNCRTMYKSRRYKPEEEMPPDVRVVDVKSAKEEPIPCKSL
jgi:hypothetical protein